MTQHQDQGQVSVGQWSFDHFCINKLFAGTTLSKLSDGLGLAFGVQNIFVVGILDALKDMATMYVLIISISN